DHTVLQGSDRGDALGCPPEHPFRLETDPLDLPGRLLHGHHGWLIQYDSFSLHVDERVGRPEIDGDVVHRNEGTGLEPAKSHVSPDARWPKRAAVSRPPRYVEKMKFLKLRRGSEAGKQVVPPRPTPRNRRVLRPLKSLS